MKTILKILQHRIFIAILLSLILIITIPFNFKKYIAKKEQVTISGSNLNYTFFVDINNNSYSEYYEFNHDKLGNREFFNLLNHSGGIISVLNLQDFLLPRSVIGFNDFNHNQIPELNFLSFNADSIFLNIYEVKLLDQNKTNQVDTIIYFKRKFISTAHYYNDVLDIVSDSIRFADLNNDGFDEAILNLEAGFSLQPRRIFAYDIKHDSLWAMPREATMILDFIPYDLNHDNIPEILLTTYSPNNAFPENIIKEFKKSSNPDTIKLYNYYRNFAFKYDDNHPWLMTLNANLDFLFPPVKFPIGYGYVNTKPFKIKDKTYILAKYENTNDIHIEPKLMLFDLYGNKFKEKKLQKNTERLNFAFLNYNKSFADIRIIDESKKMIYKISPDLTLTDPIKTFEGYHSNVTCTIDIDRDNNKELLFLSNDLEKILITRNDFSFPVIISIPNNHQGIKAITIKKRGPNLPPLLAIQFSRVLYLFSYTKNPLYFFKYLIYLGIFIFTYLLIYLLQKINSVKLEKEKQQLELEIRKRTLDISEKNKHLKEFRKEITLSIDYAKYIQDSIFPKQESLIEIFKESFLIFLPRDIVSGDFYWWTKVDNSIYLSVSDCTGHGVPGAFMSILGITYLQQTIMIEDVKKPALILNNLRQKIIRALKQTGEPNEQYDGMDMILLQIDQKTNTVYFSGAHNSIYVVTENDFFAYNLSLKNSHQVRVEKKGKIFFIEIKGDKMPVAIYKKMDDFSEVRIKVKKGDTIYSFTDGYYDQFGGTYGKKIKLAPIKTMLINNYYDSMTYQKQSLLDYLQYWKENHHLKTEQFDQIDDITILGIKF